MQKFFGRIIDSLYRTATGPQRFKRRMAPLFASFFAGAVVLAIILSLYLDRFFGLARFVSPAAGMVIALPILAVGVPLWLVCVWRFLKAKGTPVPVSPPPTLVTDGPYAYTRNPMMTGVFLMLAGIGVWNGSVVLTCVTTPLAVLVSVLEFRLIEEPELERRFGQAYRDYRARTPLLIPSLRRCNKPPK
jgi:protein-S-isoprenylcysteine O-methyltransferase Ste14